MAHSDEWKRMEARQRQWEREKLGRAAKSAKAGAGTLEASKEESDKKDGSQATRLIEIGKTADLWHTPAGDAYATISTEKARQNVPLKSKQFRRWLQHQFFLAHEKAAGGQAVQDAIGA